MSQSHLSMRFPNGRAKALTLSYDDGVFEDIRLIEIMKKHGLRGTFNLNSEHLQTADPSKQNQPGSWASFLTAEQAKALYDQDGLEPATHAYSHPFLHRMPSASVAREMLEDRVFLEKLFERPIRGMAYPYGTYSDRVVDVLESCGIVYSRTVTSTGQFTIPTDWLRMPATCHHNDEKLGALTEKFLTKAHGRSESPWLFYLWGHSYEFERDQNWNVIEEFAEKIGGREDIWYATNMEVYDYVKAYESLIFTVEMDYVTNPSAQTVWFYLRGNLCEVPAGQTVKLD